MHTGLQLCDTTLHTSIVRTIGALYMAINVQHDYHSEILIIIGLTC